MSQLALRRSFGAAAVLFTVSGCADHLRGVPRLVDSAGVVQAPANSKGLADTALSAKTLDLRQRFRAHAALAVSADSDQPAYVAQMVRSGTLLARANCDDFFANAALLQQRMNLSRDMVAPVISILTNVLALRSLGNSNHDDYLKILSIGSSAVLAGISIVDQRFLFGAENIKEVQDLTVQALDAHEQAVEEMGVTTFDDGIQQLIDHQVICTPASILSLTKQAIAAGRVTAETASSSDQDHQVLVELASTLGLIGTATPKQAAALWALYQGGVSADAIPAVLERDLKATGLGRLINPSVPAQPAMDTEPPIPARAATLSTEGQAKADQIIAALHSLSAGTQTQLAQAAAGASEGRASLQDSEIVLAARKARTVKLVVH